MAAHKSSPRRRIDWDDGVASERTMLAWQRTALSTTVVALLIIRAGVVHGPAALGLVLGMGLLGVAVWQWLFSRRIYIEHDRPHAHGAILHAEWKGALAAVTVIAATGSVVLALNS
jgi:uncharacterized membrane protein YidH (DUF202 family)